MRLHVAFPQGWEESCDAAVSHLLRTCLSRSPKDQATSLAQTGGQVLGLPRDTERLKRHISLLCERIAKGGRLTLASEANVQVPAQVQNLAAPGKSGRGDGWVDGWMDNLRRWSEDGSRANWPLKCGVF